MARKKAKKKSVVDSAVRNAAVLTDGCNPEFVKGAKFDGIFEMPIIKKPSKIIIPDNLIPFSKIDRSSKKSFAVCEYENDSEFKDLLSNPDDYVKKIKKYQGFITPDCSVYRDMPLAIQITNIYRNRAIGYYMQSKGIYVIPNVRWGDERTYTTKYLPEKIAFKGIQKKSIVSIGAYGQIQNKVNRYYFLQGLDEMIKELEPKVILVYGKLPEEVKEQYRKVKFVEYQDYTSLMRNK